MGGSSKSASSSATTYQNTDQRVVADGFGVGVSGADNNVAYSVTMNSLDGGAIRESAEVVRAALQTVSKADATAGEGFGKLLDLAGNLFEGGAVALERSQALTADAYRQAQEVKQGTIDNKTITVIAIAGAAAVIGYAAVKK